MIETFPLVLGALLFSFFVVHLAVDLYKYDLGEKKKPRKKRLK
jgi:hypothetical protein